MMACHAESIILVSHIFGMPISRSFHVKTFVLWVVGIARGKIHLPASISHREKFVVRGFFQPLLSDILHSGKTLVTGG